MNVLNVEKRISVQIWDLTSTKHQKREFLIFAGCLVGYMALLKYKNQEIVLKLSRELAKKHRKIP